MKYLCVVLIVCVTNLKGSVLRAGKELPCTGVKTYLAKIDDALLAITHCSEDIEDPAVPPTSTLNLLNTELDKYKIPLLAHKNCISPENKTIIGGLSSKISALKAAFDSTITQYTKLNKDLKTTYADECKDPDSQSSEALWNDATKVHKAISVIKKNDTNMFNQVVQSVQTLPSSIFSCLLAYKYLSINTTIFNFNISVRNVIESQRVAISSIFAQNLTNLEYAIHNIQRFDEKHQKQYLKTCSSKPNIDHEVNACLTKINGKFDSIYKNLTDFYTINITQQFNNAVSHISKCMIPQCIDASIEEMQTVQANILSDLNGLRNKNLNSLIESTKAAAIKNFSSKIDENFDCYLKILASGAGNLSLFKMSVVSLVLLVLTNFIR